MLKLLICLFAATMMSVCVLELRQQRLELSREANQIHAAIEASQSRLWSQQLQIAIYTAPNAIAKTVGVDDLKLSPQPAIGTTHADWTAANSDPAAE
jgi:cell division protein FtsL